MNIKQQKLIIGCLLHDFGKLLYRYNDGRNHSTSGYDFLKNIETLKDEREILDCVRYHHSGHIKNADIDKDALCYIAYIADNIASAADRRAKETAEGGFVKDISSESIFNILNNNNEHMVYKPDVISYNSDINYPTGDKINYSETFYGKIVDNIKNSLNGIEFTGGYINSLLQLLQSNLCFIPSSTQTGELRDISLYDHLKLTAAFGICIEQYLEEKAESDYKTVLYDNSKKFYDEKAFRICSIDLSGIQSFIYNISKKSALKGLRARSFYLEILMEYCVDELLNRTDLSRANVMYTGGGHTYIIMPATVKISDTIKKFETEINNWFLKTFGTGLYAAIGYADCSSNNLKNIPEGSYKSIFSEISRIISEKKLHRYTYKQIIELNKPKAMDLSRECKICHRSDRLDENSECSICSGLKSLSDMIISDNSVFFTIMKQTQRANVPVPFGGVLTSFNESELFDIIKNNRENYIIAYSKNREYTGYNVASNLWVGDYIAEKSFEELAEKAYGIKRLAVLRADIDNLGQAFVSGFERDRGRYSTITRTSVFSRKLSEFFKLHIIKILEKGEFQLFSDKNTARRNAAIVYSGGDDVFVVGGWDDILCFAIDMYNSFKRFSQGTLTISAGLGIFGVKYPISRMAEKAGDLESLSKIYNNSAKNAITLFDGDSTYNWEEFINKVIGEKLRLLESYIDNNGEHAKAMLYKMLELIRNRNKENRLNIARFAYLIARLRPNRKLNEDKYDELLENYNKFSKKIYRWIQSEEDSKQLVTAIYIYIYMNRERKEENYE